MVPVVEAAGRRRRRGVDRHPQGRGRPGRGRRRGRAWSTTCRPRWPRWPPPTGVAFVAMHMLGDPRTMQDAAPSTTTWSSRCATSSSPGPTPPGPPASPTCGSTPASGSARRSTTTSTCSPTSTCWWPPATRCSWAPAASRCSARWPPAPTAPGAAVPPADRPARGLDRHRGLGPAAGRGHGAGPRRGGDRAGARCHRGHRGCGGVKHDKET